MVFYSPEPRGVVAGIGIDSNNTGLQLFANASTLNDANADLTS